MKLICHALFALASSRALIAASGHRRATCGTGASPVHNDPWRCVAGAALLHNGLLSDDLSFVQISAHPRNNSLEGTPLVSSDTEFPSRASLQGSTEVDATGPPAQAVRPLDELGELLKDDNVVDGLKNADLTPAMVKAYSNMPAPSPNPFRTSTVLESHSLRFNNHWFCVIVGSVVALTLTGHELDRMDLPRLNRFKAAHLSWCVILLIAAGYLCWIPAMLCEDFSFNISFQVPFDGPRLGVTKDWHNDHKPGPIHESTCTLISLLWNTGSKGGAFFIALYAFGVPMAKLFLLASGEYWRRSDNKLLVTASWWCIVLVRYISKWVASDLFVYAILYCCLRNLQHLPIDVLIVFDIGFTCYSVFTVVSTISSLGIPLPEIKKTEKTTETVRQPLALRIVGEERLFSFVAFLLFMWALLFTLGVVFPCFALRLNGERLKGHVPKRVQVLLPFIDVSQVDPPQDVSLGRALCALFAWFVKDGDLNLLLAFLMFIVFTIACTALDMAWLLVAAYQLRQSSKVTCRRHEGFISPEGDILVENMTIEEAKSRVVDLPECKGFCFRGVDTEQPVEVFFKNKWDISPGSNPWVSYCVEDPSRHGWHPCPAIEKAGALKHVSMLDVLIISIILCRVAGAIYKQVGVEFYISRGMALLITSEVMHNFTHHTVYRAAEYKVQVNEQKRNEILRDARRQDLATALEAVATEGPPAAPRLQAAIVAAAEAGLDEEELVPAFELLEAQQRGIRRESKRKEPETEPGRKSGKAGGTRRRPGGTTNATSSEAANVTSPSLDGNGV